MTSSPPAPRVAAGAPPVTTATRAGQRRLDGIDVARALAIIGMVTVHFGPYPVTATDAVATVYASAYGRASVLFIVVAGMGVALLGRRQSVAEVRGRLLYRFVWLLPLGLWLQTLNHPVAVILQYYAVYFLLLAPFVTGRASPGVDPVGGDATARPQARDGRLLAWAAGLLVVGSAAVLVARVQVPEWILPLAGDSPLTYAAEVAGDVLLLGYYPAVTWLPPMLVGYWLGRRDLTSDRVRRQMVGYGFAALVGTQLLGAALPRLLGVTPEPSGSWAWALSTAGHSEMPLAVIGSTGLAVAIVGAMLLVASRWRRLMWPLAALGRLALSVYVGHLIVFHLVEGLLSASTVAEGVRTVAAFTVVTALLSMAWLAAFVRGPLEASVRWPWQHLLRPLATPRDDARH